MRVRLEQLPPHYQAQAQAQLDRGARKAPPFFDCLPPRSPAQAEAPRRTQPKKRAPNKTERRFNVDFLGGLGMYEAVTFRLPGGSRYTPDWVSFDDAGRMTVYEVKGAYRFHSQGRALTAFREARAAFPLVRFRWFVWVDGRWSEKYEENK